MVRENIKNNLKKMDSPEKFNSIVDKSKFFEFDYLNLFNSACVKLNKKLKSRRSIESFLSGATGCMVMIHREKIITANIGDSRAVLYQFKLGKMHNELAPIRITRDHTPTLPGEKKRILNSGGMVYKMKSKL